MAAPRLAALLIAACILLVGAPAFAAELGRSKEVIPGFALGAPKSSFGSLEPAGGGYQVASTVRFAGIELREVRLFFEQDRLVRVLASTNDQDDFDACGREMYTSIAQDLRARFSDAPHLAPLSLTGNPSVRKQELAIAMFAGARDCVLIAGKSGTVTVELRALELPAGDGGKRCRLDIVYYDASASRASTDASKPRPAPPPNPAPRPRVRRLHGFYMTGGALVNPLGTLVGGSFEFAWQWVDELGAPARSSCSIQSVELFVYRLQYRYEEGDDYDEEGAGTVAGIRTRYYTGGRHSNGFWVGPGFAVSSARVEIVEEGERSTDTYADPILALGLGYKIESGRLAIDPQIFTAFGGSAGFLFGGGVHAGLQF